MHKQRLQSVATRQQNEGFQRVPFGTRPLKQRCSVLYLLARLTGKMRVLLDGNARFDRQESGQFFASGNEQKACSISEVTAGIEKIT